MPHQHNATERARATYPVAGGAEGRAQPGPVPGLVEEETSHTRLPPGVAFQAKISCPGTIRQTLKELGKKRRLRRMRWVVTRHAEATRDACQKGGHRLDAIMITPTYRPGVEWHARHMSSFVNCVRNHLARRGIRMLYQWVMELQQRGAPHYHLVLWVPKGTRLPKPDDQGWWPHGSTRIELARKGVAYLVKYASKGDDGDMPKGARLYGVGNPDSDVRFAAHRAALPCWLNKAATPGCRVRRVPRVGWVEPDTGIIHRSPFSLHWGMGPDGRFEVTINRGEVYDAN